MKHRDCKVAIALWLSFFNSYPFTLAPVNWATSLHWSLLRLTLCYFRNLVSQKSKFKLPQNLFSQVNTYFHTTYACYEAFFKAIGPTVHEWQQRRLCSFLNACISHSCRTVLNLTLQATTVTLWLSDGEFNYRHQIYYHHKSSLILPK
jgi:hypothetical protein